MRYKRRHNPSKQMNAEMSARNAETLRVHMSDDGDTQVTHRPAAEPEDAHEVSSLKDQLARMEQAHEQQPPPQAQFTPEEQAFLQQHPHLTHNMYVLTHSSADAILHGLPRGTPEHLHFVKGKVEHLNEHHRRLGLIKQHQEQQAQQPQAEPQTFAQGGAVEALEPEPEPMPEPEREAPPPEPKREQRPYVSHTAPVTREAPSMGSGRRESHESNRPTPMDIEGAKINGITPEEYMRQRLKLKQMRKDGEYRDNTR